VVEDAEVLGPSAEDDSTKKEATLVEARKKHVKAAMDDVIRFVIRPSNKTEFKNLFQESGLIQNRHTLRSASSQPETDAPWRHGWIYDAGADVEPSICSSSHRSPFSWPPQVDVAVAKMFFESAVAIHDEKNDLFLMPSSRSKTAAFEFQKAVGPRAFKDDLNIHYRECQKRGARNSHEVVYAAHSKQWPGQGRCGPRKFYTATTLASDCLVQAQDFSSGSQPEELACNRSLKEAILGLEMMTPREQELPPAGSVVLFHWEKDRERVDGDLPPLRLEQHCDSHSWQTANAAGCGQHGHQDAGHVQERRAPQVAAGVPAAMDDEGLRQRRGGVLFRLPGAPHRVVRLAARPCPGRDSAPGEAGGRLAARVPEQREPA